MPKTPIWKTKEVSITQLRPWPKNPRKLTPEHFERLKARIGKRGFHDVLKATKDNIVISGNQRLKALQELGYTKIEVKYPDRSLTETEMKEVAYESNIQDGEWIREMLQGDDPAMLLDIGFDSLFVDKLQKLEAEDKDDAVPAVPKVAKSKLGEVYQLGRHRIMCGDSTNPESVAKLMAGFKADMVFTDPPYNVNYSGRGKNTSNKIMNDHMSDESFDTFLIETFKRYAEHSQQGAGWYVFHSSSTSAQFEAAISQAGWNVKNTIIWNKPVASMGWGDYRWKHEPMFYCGNKNTKFYGDRTSTTILDIPADEASAIKWLRKQRELDKEGHTTIWTMAREKLSGYKHPTQKPVELITYAIFNSSHHGQTVLDLFLGSGSTLIAAEKTGRICYGMELDPKYVDVVIQRWQEYTSQKARKL